MSNSSLVNYRRLSPNRSSRDGSPIKKITIHHMAANLSIEQCGDVFAPTSRGASATYGVGTDGRIGQYVDEAFRPWTSGSYENDKQAVTIEVANDQIGGNWHVGNVAIEATINLCVDICKRNGISKLIFTGNASGNLTMHKYFQATACPGRYLESKFPYIAEEVNKRLNGGSTTVKPPTSSQNGNTVKIVNDAIYVLNGPGPNYGIVQTVYKNEVFTIVDTNNGYGKLKSGLGWIYLGYTKPVTTNSSQSNAYTVKIVNAAIYILDAANVNANIVGTVYKNEVYTIVEVQNGYGKLKSGAGWIYLGYTSRV